MNSREIEKVFKQTTRDKYLVELRNANFDNEPITVSILCLCYNHEKYLDRCIEGFLKQKVNFNVEILIHDDASTDGSASIIQEYAKKYSFIKPIIQKENQYSKGVNIENSILSKLSRGKYITICEADDYWMDSFKLATQVSLFEKYDHCHFVVHKVGKYDFQGKYIEYIPNIPMKSGIYDRKEILPTLIEKYLFHTTSYMFRADEYKKYCENLPKFAKEMTVGDYALQLYFSNLGKIIYLKKELSAHVHDVPGSWTDKSHHKSFEESMKHQDNINSCLGYFNDYTSNEFHKNYENRLNKIQMHKLYHEKKYAEIMNNKAYSKALKKYDCHSYRIIYLMIKHPKLYKFLKRF